MHHPGLISTGQPESFRVSGMKSIIETIYCDDESLLITFEFESNYLNNSFDLLASAV